MPRTARERTSTNVYHAVLRGVNKQQIHWDRLTMALSKSINDTKELVRESTSSILELVQKQRPKEKSLIWCL